MSPALILLALAHAGPKDAMAEYGTIEAKRLHVHLDLDPAEPTYTGTTTLTFEHSKPVEEVVLHAAEGMEFTSVAFVRGNRRWTATATPLGDEKVAIRADKPVSMDGFKLARPKKAANGEPLFATPSFVSVEVVFTNSINTQPFGLYSFNVDDQPYLVTQFEADDAREAFPCIDLPDHKVSFWLELTVPKDLVALSNGGVVRETVDEEAGTKHVIFDRTRPIPTYAMAMAVGPYSHIDIPGSKGGKLYTVPGREADAAPFAAEIAPLQAELEDWFGTPYPYAKLDFLGVPEFAFGGMENPGLIVFADRFLMPEDQRAPGQRRWQQEIIAHEIAHMWFGNLVTLAWWDDFWLNESFAEQAGNRAAAAVTQDPGFAFTRVGSTQSALSMDGRGTMRPVRTEIDPNRIFETTNFLAYPKGEALLAMVENWIGPDEFRTGVRYHIDAGTDGNATSADLFRWLSHASEHDIGPMLSPWLDRPGGPLIHLEPTTEGLKWRQERYLAAGAEAESEAWWTTPLNLRWKDEGGVHSQVVLLDAPEGMAPIPWDGQIHWLNPHAEGLGYYAWTLPEESLSDLVETSATEQADHERAALVGNLDLLATAGVIKGGHLLLLLEDFAAETHPSVMGDVLSAQGFVNDVRDGKHSEAWAAYVQATRRPWLDRIGIEAADGEDEEVPQLRARLLEELLYEGRDDDIRARFLAAGQAFLDDEANYDRTWTGTGLRELAKKADPGLFDTLVEKADATDNPRHRSLYLGVLGRVPEGADRAMAMALDPEVPLRDTWAVMSSLPDDSDEDEDRALDWLIANHDALAEKFPPQQRAFFARVGAGCHAERWARSKAFFGAEERRSPAVDRTIAEGDETLALCIAARELHGESVAAVLAEYLDDVDAD